MNPTTRPVILFVETMPIYKSKVIYKPMVRFFLTKKKELMALKRALKPFKWFNCFREREGKNAPRSDKGGVSPITVERFFEQTKLRYSSIKAFRFSSKPLLIWVPDT